MQTYPLAQIRRFILETFSEEEIDVLCFDHFPEVFANFGRGMTPVQKVLQLLSYCQNRDTTPELLAILHDLRNKQFVNQFPNLLERQDSEVTELEEEEIGFLDALEAFEDHQAALTDCVSRIQTLRLNYKKSGKTQA